MSYLFVNEGIPQPPSVNPAAADLFQKKRAPILQANEYVAGIKAQDRSILSQAITLIESTRPDHRQIAHKVLDGCLPHSGKSIRIGITGVPGAGKSTFIEAFGSLLTQAGHHLAVLAIDPSSQRSHGSILGDKTRMETLSADPLAFIRPSPSAGSLGGVARKTRESVILCEAAGYDVIFIETVGVGQSEIAVHSMTDFFLLLLLSGAGDELQGIKRGIMEMADLIVITKADGSNVEKASMAQALSQSALRLFPPSLSGWKPTALTSSALEKKGLDEICTTIQSYFTLTRTNGYLEQNRRDQARYWMLETVKETLLQRFFGHPHIESLLPVFEEKLRTGSIDSFAAAAELLYLFDQA
ncbi:MAG: methylmalonyl Co-A mutase-associated GTPase MeaB [Prevotellaceae bacterium]|jgi:LAO/AO transport system kinase|nr:methylmalonyl Co-A mutase-associated GTPase MeaB [Prevotellaceae bacterium]